MPENRSLLFKRSALCASPSLPHRRGWRAGSLVFLASMMLSQFAFAQTGVDDDRVSLPEGPGSIEGMGDNVEIDPNMGSMRYSISINTPAGRLGMAPDFTLSYSSSAPAGLLGVGWSMQTPTIERMTSRGIPNYDRDDLFAADGGTELARVVSEGDRQVYRERFEKSFKRYTWHEPGEDGTQGYFTAESPDGSIEYYGAIEDGTYEESARSGDSSLGVSIYHLVEKVDPYGNRVRYHYNRDGSQRALLSRVEWMFHEGTPMYSATLDYELRPDLLSDCGAGYEDVLMERLSGIKIFMGEELLREAKLTYQIPSLSGGLSRLQKVERWGVGGETGGLKDPLEPSFDYQRALGVECSGASCALPQIVSMGSLSGGGSLASGSATLVDINGDGLPDVLDTSQNSAHTFSINTLTADDSGAFSQNFSTTIQSGEVTGQQIRLGERVQTFDVNGDGYSDLVDTATGNFLLNNPDASDWLDPQGSLLDVDELKSIDFGNARFFDYNNDKKIDVLISVGNTTQVLRNTGDGFELQFIDSIGVGFADSNLQMADMNGDGLNDPVEIIDGQVHFRANLGNGRWTDWRDLPSEAVPTSERELMELEDLNGDSLDDIVIVTATQVKYALNRNDRFDDFVTISSSNLGVDLPERTDGVRVLYADMNANGSEDIVWISASGKVDYLEMFPERPNLLSEVRNGLGAIQRVRYGTAAEHAARAAQANAHWDLTLQTPLAVVDEVDIFELLTGDEDGGRLHDVTTYTYRNGYYDGVEKQMRGFERVEAMGAQSEYQESFTQIFEYDLGKEDRYRNGLLQGQSRYSDDRLIDRTTFTYASCSLAEVPSEAELEADGQFPIRFMCLTQEDREVIEGHDDKAKTITTSNTYDGYGNVIKSEAKGDISNDADDLTTETTFVAPSSRWLLNLPATVSVYNDPSGDRTEERYYYDGADFTGESLGTATHGFLSRKTVKVDDQKTLTSLRQKRDQYGNVIEVIDANGSLDDNSVHRRRYTMDDFGLFVTRTTLTMGEYDLVRDSSTDYAFQQTSGLTNWMVAVGDTIMSERADTRIVYDGLGRTAEIYREGDDNTKPSLSYEYSYGEPVSRVLEFSRSEQNGELDRQSAKCIDGLGRITQLRNKEGSSSVFVDGYSAFDRRGNAVAIYQPYQSSTLDCDTTPPSDVRFTTVHYDGLGRTLRSVRPDADLHDGTPSMAGFAYEPLRTIAFDENDLDESSPFFNTPLVRDYDGQDRLTSITRVQEGGSLEGITTTLHYDNTGSFSGYTDDQGNRHELSVDLAGRITRATNANFGEYLFEYDDQGNLVRSTDPRGVVLQREYDPQNRVLAIYDAAAREDTLIDYTYDVAPTDCPQGMCNFVAGQLAGVSYPLGQLGRGQDMFGFDALERSTYVGRRFGQLTQWDTTREYDHVGRVIAVSLPDGSRMTRRYDALDREVAIPNFINKVNYSEQNMLDHITWSNLSELSITYDANLRPTDVIHTNGIGELMARFAYQLDRSGRVTRRTSSSDLYDWFNGTDDYAYDTLYRLTQLKLDGQSEAAMSWSYDSLDRIMSQNMLASVANVLLDLGDFSYDTQSPLQLTGAGEGISLSYDGMGHVTQHGDLHMEWDELRRLTKMTRGEQSKSIYYSPDGTRVARLGNDSVELFGIDGYESRDGVSSLYVTLNDQKLVRRDRVDATTSGHDPSTSRQTAARAWFVAQGEEDSELTVSQHLGAAAAQMLQDLDESQYSLHSDDTSSILMVSNEEGITTGARQYWPTGAERQSEGVIDVYGFQGQEYEPLSRLIHFKMRQYDPRIARWMSYDPAYIKPDAGAMLDVTDSVAGYAMVGNDFMNKTDANGLGQGSKGSNSNAATVKRNQTASQKRSDINRTLAANQQSQANNLGAPVASSAQISIKASGNNANANGNKAPIENFKFYDPKKSDAQNFAAFKKETGLSINSTAFVYGSLKQKPLTPEQRIKEMDQRKDFNKKLLIGGGIGFVGTGAVIGGVIASILFTRDDDSSPDNPAEDAQTTAPESQ